MLNFSHYKSILCLNGDLPEALFFDQNLPIIATDGAANTLMDQGIKPDLVIGDLDSISPRYLTQLKTLHRPDQNFSDFQKSLSYLKENDLLPAVIVGVNGGFLDHVLNNINHFLDSKSVLYAPPLYGYVMHSHEKRAFTTPLNTKISLLGIPNAIVSSRGLKWKLSKEALSFPGKTSCFNRSISADIEIEVHTGRLLVLIYNE